MDTEIRLMPSHEGRAEIALSVPAANALVVLEAIRGMLTLAGHKVRKINAEGEELFSAREVFPEGNAAMLLRGYRVKLDLTQKELAEKLGTTQNRVSDMESGKRPISKNMAVKLGQLFDTPYKSFL
ncbi:MAG: helix-turn-helix protein [Candidatus Desulfovibrio kirbyi]|jgi:DNA-binding XRE family transcriptional regulator|uniref:Helix-turn-helix protein n=1 Tax=Candidatus Desulfovibrio kirbyi TaxID=2696086 RepID=A0A6L2R737_9BACT|nr:MAG: helix-turn-helix protein [Candidatus Desulfovibrio kirbyi]